MKDTKEQLEQIIEYWINVIKYPKKEQSMAERKKASLLLERYAGRYHRLTGEYYDVTKKGGRK